MQCGDADAESPRSISSYHGPYHPSLAASASSSASSVWSDAASQSSDDTSVSSESSRAAAAAADAKPAYVRAAHPLLNLTLPAEQRQHPRRTSTSTVSRSGPPPLVRQCDRRLNFVDNLVDSSAQIVEVIWPRSAVPCRSEMGSKGVLPLRTFIQETLRRSRTSYSTLQVALYYLILIKPHVPRADGTGEPRDDAHASRALQCGRRMFLAALILASKYLQDRNYSARAWSKISGLNTQEINQNEMAFLLAVNWKLHITDAVFQRWSGIVLKHTPSAHPPAPGAAMSPADWKAVILQLSPGLENMEELLPHALPVAGAKSCTEEATGAFSPGSEVSSPPRSLTPQILEPSPAAAYTPLKAAPALGLLPTPRLTPQGAGLHTPAVSVTPCPGRAAMGMAMAQVNGICAAQTADRWPGALNPPATYAIPRRSSLANSTSSIMSSPESMVSDVSSRRSSRASSFSSAASSMAAAPPLATKLGVLARCRSAKQCSEKHPRTMILAVPEDDAEALPTASPESYTGPVGRDLLDLSLATPAASHDGDADYFARDSVNDAAAALQELHNHPRTAMRGAKRSRPLSSDGAADLSSLHENVREMLRARYPSPETSWSDALLRTDATRDDATTQFAVRTPSDAMARKRLCCAAEARYSLPYHSNLAAYSGVNTRPGVWQGILN